MFGIEDDFWDDHPGGICSCGLSDLKREFHACKKAARNARKRERRQTKRLEKSNA